MSKSCRCKAAPVDVVHDDQTFTLLEMLLKSEYDA